MLTYEKLKEKPKEFLAATGLTVKEFELVVPIFRVKYAGWFEAGKTRKGKPRQRQEGGGVKEKLWCDEDKLLFILVYQKTYPLQTMHGLQFELSQPQVNYWIHRLMPILRESLSEMGMTDTVRIMGNEAAAYAEQNKAVELEYYDIVCAPTLGPIPALAP
jgi:hypothetical protein